MNKYINDEARVQLAREIAQEAMVLLENDNHCLPLAKGSLVALFGRTQNDTVIGGGGSGASFSEGTLQIATELKKSGLILESGIEDFYTEVAQKENEAKQAQAAGQGAFDTDALAGLVASGMIYELFGKYEAPKEEPLPEETLVQQAAKACDTAICMIGRCAGGEECDRRVENDYYLTASEQQMVDMAAKNFSKVVVVYNVNGLVDMGWMKRYPQIQAVIFMGSTGEQAAGALADIITGVVSPSGKMSQTIALSYEDYPTAKNISCDKDDPRGTKTYGDYGLCAADNGSTEYATSPVTVYEEDIYVGYRYFDSFGKEVLYPFGHGLSYGSFTSTCDSARITEGKLQITASVKNTSTQFAGKEVVQMYMSAPVAGIKKPMQELKGFVKTKLLAPGESETVVLEMNLCDMASFHEDVCAYVIEPGCYEFQLKNSAKAEGDVVAVTVAERMITRSLSADIGLTQANKGKVSFMEPEGTPAARDKKIVVTLEMTVSDIKYNWPTDVKYDFSQKAVTSTLADVAAGRVSMEAFINQMSVKELAVLCNGYGPGLPFGGIGQEAPSTIKDDEGRDIGYNSHPSAFPGYENPAIRKYGIFSSCYKDGPASVGKVAWPTGMMVSCTFNTNLMYEFGSACGAEAEMQDVDSWLAPGMNIIRNPIEGRAFEYFSEDPYLCGTCGTAITRGAMDNNDITTCPKHFALNEQETYRRGSTKKNIDAVDSIASARAAREIYLKPFEMVITQAKPRTIMTSFNKVNGTFAAGSKVLNTDILRDEWGYTGVVVTDWGDMDAVVDGADAVAAGNDVVMPGGPPVIAQVLQGYEEGRVTLDEMKTAVAHLMNYVMNSKSFKDSVKCNK